MCDQGMGRKIAVLDIGGTSIKSGIYENGRLSGQKETDTNAMRGGDYVMEQMVHILREMGEFERIGVSTAGQVDSQAGVIRYANSNIPGYTGMRIRDLLQEEFLVPAAVENDVNAAALGEAAFGAGQGYPDFLCLTYGTGVGGAIVKNGSIDTGAGFSAGEFGAMVVHASDREPQRDIFSGCYERYASTTALVTRAKAADPSLQNGRAVFGRLEEEFVRQIVDDWILEIVYGLTTLVHIFNPSCIILGGGVMSQKYVLKKVQEVLYNHIMPSFRDVTIKAAQLGNTAGLLGAASLAEKMEE